MNRYMILPLLLQPIVENAIVHGLERKEEKGHVSIIIEREKEDKLIVTVKDNGGGIDDKKLEQMNQLMNEKRTDDSSSIGLYNINQRVKLFYGEAYGVVVKSELMKGTSVSVLLPLKYGSEE